MSTNLAVIRAELESLKWQDLRTKAQRDYGIKLLPEYKAEDIVRLILDKERGEVNYVTERKDDGESKWGWSRIKVLPGRRESDTHCRASHNGYRFAIPFNVELSFPTVSAEFLTTKKNPVPFETNNGQTEIRYEDRWIVQFIEKNYGPNGDIGYIPPSQRGKYWNESRESKLQIKRDFFEQFGFWPTDKRLREYMSAGMFNYMRRAEKKEAAA